MKSVFVTLCTLWLLIDPTAIGKINTAKSEAKKAYNDGKYKEAIQKYRYLIDKLGVDEDEVKMNLANAYYLENDTTNAKPLYQELTQSTKNKIRSNAFQQLGVMTNKKGKSEEALNQFKQAIKADPTNEDARYNYEMLKKKLEEQKKQQQKDQNKDQKDQQNKDQQNKDENKKDQKDKKDEKKDQQNKDQKDQQNKDQKDQQQKDQEKKDQEKKDQNKDQKDQQKKDQQNKEEQQKKDQKDQQQSQEQKDEQQKKDNQKVPPQVADKLKQMNISEEKAKMILEAMKNQEVQYLQQNKRKASKPRDKGKPDW